MHPVGPKLHWEPAALFSYCAGPGLQQGRGARSAAGLWWDGIAADKKSAAPLGRDWLKDPAPHEQFHGFQVSSPPSLRPIPLPRNLLQHGVVSGFGLVGGVKGQGRTARTMRMVSDPRVLVGESPGLNCVATGILQA